MKKSILSLLLASFCSSFAFADYQDVSDIINLAQQVELAARSTQASDGELQDVKSQLRDILSVLNQTNPNPGTPGTGDCFDFAYAKYYVSQSSQTATNNAVAACKKIRDLPVAKFLYEKHYVSLSSASAMDLAADQSGSSMIDKEDMVRFAYDKYYVSYSATASATRSAQAIAPVRRGSLSCLKSLYDKYYVSMSSAAAMDAAAQGCR